MKLPRARATPNASSLPVSEDAGRGWFAALSVVIAAYLFLVIGVQRLAESSAWITGDWLINYSDGFIRRGLVGEIGRQLHYAAGIDPVWVVVICKACCYAVMCAALLILARRRTTSLAEIVILLSPALLPFEINDPLGSGRKEVFLLAVFMLYVVADEFQQGLPQPPTKQWRFWYLVVTLPLLTLIHEGLFFFFPFFFLYAWLKHDDARREAVGFAVPYVISVAVMALSWAFRGSSGIAAAMCSSLTSMALNPEMCKGATAALERYDVRIGLADMQRYVWLAILTFGPLLWYSAEAISAPRRRRFLTGIALACLSTTPLYAASEDWGRWLHVAGMLVFMTALACKDVNIHLPARRPALAVPVFAAIAIFAFSWQLPHWIHSPLPVIRPSAEQVLLLVKAHVL